MSLTSFKRRWIEKWCEEVHQHLREGSICNNVIGVPFEGVDDDKVNGILKTAIPLKRIELKPSPNFEDNINGNISAKLDTLKPLPVVRFSYSHYQDQRKKVERLSHGLPVLSNSTTQLENGFQTEDSSVPFIIVQGEEPIRMKRDGNLERNKMTSAPASLTAQRLAQEFKRTSQEVSNGGFRVNYMNSDSVNRMKTSQSVSRSNVSRARRLLAKRNQSSRKLDGQPYSPIENCWTMAEMTLT